MCSTHLPPAAKISDLLLRLTTWKQTPSLKYCSQLLVIKGFNRIGRVTPEAAAKEIVLLISLMYGASAGRRVGAVFSRRAIRPSISSSAPPSVELPLEGHGLLTDVREQLELVNNSP